MVPTIQFTQEQLASIGLVSLYVIIGVEFINQLLVGLVLSAAACVLLNNVISQKSTNALTKRVEAVENRKITELTPLNYHTSSFNIYKSCQDIAENKVNTAIKEHNNGNITKLEMRRQIDITNAERNTCMELYVLTIRGINNEIDADQAEIKADKAEINAEIEAEIKADKAEIKADKFEIKADKAEIKADKFEIKADKFEIKADEAEIKAEIKADEAEQVSEIDQAEIDQASGNEWLEYISSNEPDVPESVE